MISLEGSAISPDAECALAIVVAASALGVRALGLAVLSADSAGFTGRVFEATQSDVIAIGLALGEGWSASLGVDDQILLTKVSG